MTEIKQHQLDELSVADILSYLGARVSSMEEDARRNKKRITRAKEIIKELLDTQSCLDPYGDIFKARILKAEQFLREVEK